MIELLCDQTPGRNNLEREALFWLKVSWDFITAGRKALPVGCVYDVVAVFKASRKLRVAGAKD